MKLNLSDIKADFSETGLWIEHAKHSKILELAKALGLDEKAEQELYIKDDEFLANIKKSLMLNDVIKPKEKTNQPTCYSCGNTANLKPIRVCEDCERQGVKSHICVNCEKDLGKYLS